jgi:hypothetical protein
MMTSDLQGLAARDNTQPVKLSADEKKERNSELWVHVGPIAFALIASSVFLWFGKITNVQWVDVIKWVPVAMAASYGAMRTYKKTRLPQ